LTASATTAVLSYKSLAIGQPEHLPVLFTVYTPSRRLHQPSDRQLLSQPAENTVFASQPIAHKFTTAARIWNSLPLVVRSAQSVTTFRRHLKTYLFSKNTVSGYG